MMLTSLPSTNRQIQIKDGRSRYQNYLSLPFSTVVEKLKMWHMMSNSHESIDLEKAVASQ